MAERHVEANDENAATPPRRLKSNAAGIQADRIEAENVVQGLQQLGGETGSTHALVALATALSNGSIRADSIQARNVVAGFQYIADPAQVTVDQLQQEIAHLRKQLAELLDAGELEDSADMTDAQDALQEAETELAAEQPQGSRVLRKLKEVSEILTAGADAASAAGRISDAVIKLAPVAAALYQIGTTVFAG